MPFLKRVLLLAGAVAALTAALVIVVQTGLPERAAFTGSISGSRAVAPEIGAIAPSFEAASLTDASLSLSDLRGETVVLNFWATWCEPCRVEMPELQALYEAHQPDGLRVLAVNLGETAAQAQQWVESLGLTFDILQDPDGRIASLYQLRGQPSTYVIAKDGVITHIFYGPASRTGLEAAVAPHLTN
jgi:peroxiredoxin